MFFFQKIFWVLSVDLFTPYNCPSCGSVYWLLADCCLIIEPGNKLDREFFISLRFITNFQAKSHCIKTVQLFSVPFDGLGTFEKGWTRNGSHFACGWWIEKQLTLWAIANYNSRHAPWICNLRWDALAQGEWKKMGSMQISQSSLHLFLTFATVER